MKKKLSKYFLFSFLLLFFPLLSFSQTIIKEKVRVSPKQTLSKIPNEVQDESQLVFQIGGALPLTTTVVGPTSTQSGSGSGGANPFVYLYFPPLNGDYQITISSTLSAGQNTNVNYAVSYQGQGISSGERWLYNGSEETAVVSTTINITITTLPEETPVDFGFEFNRYYICARDESGLVITYYNKEVTPTTNVKFGIISSVAGVELYNKNTGEVITNETTVHINDVPNLSIRLSVPYQGSDANVKVTAEISGVTREDSLKILGSGDYFSLYSEKRIWDMLEGGTIEMTVEMRGESGCDDVRLQDSTKYNLTITQGETFGHIKYPVSGEPVTTADNLSHENGKLKFKFTADGELLTSEEWAYVRVTTTNPNISPYDFIIKIHKEGMIVTLVPEAIMPGDTASIILKKKNADGTLSDFPEDQYYDAEIIGGAEYGTLYVPQWGDLSDYLLDIPPGFKFIAEEGITEPRVESTILVRTTAGIIWGRVTPGKINQQNSVQNTTDEIQYWGSGTITIGEANDTAYVKAYFAEESLVPGDTVDVIVKKVDKNGTETDFPSNTLFEVGIKEGCTAGNILTSSGELGQYFINVSAPVRFVVNNSLAAGDTNIVLRVGVPSDESTTYLPYEGMAPSGKMLSLKGKRNSVTNQMSGYCILNPFEYSGFGLASGKVDNIKIEITLIGEKSIWPKLNVPEKGYNPKTMVDIVVKKGEHPVANTAVKLMIKRIEGTGGHDHANSLSREKSGYINSETNDIILMTDQNGEIKNVEIKSGEFGGEYVFQASLASNMNVSSGVLIYYKVPGLMSLPANDYYELIGTPDNYVCQPARPTSQHYSNHYGTLKSIIAIKNIAEEYYTYSKGTKILVNDISLVYGGRFDTNNLWGGDHKEHRVGKNVDISFRGLDSNGNCIYIKQKVMEELFSKYADGILLKHTVKNPHYHMRVK